MTNPTVCGWLTRFEKCTFYFEEFFYFFFTKKKSAIFYVGRITIKFWVRNQVLPKCVDQIHVYYMVAAFPFFQLIDLLFHTFSHFLLYIHSVLKKYKVIFNHEISNRTGFDVILEISDRTGFDVILEISSRTGFDVILE